MPPTLPSDYFTAPTNAKHLYYSPKELILMPAHLLQTNLQRIPEMEFIRGSHTLGELLNTIFTRRKTNKSMEQLPHVNNQNKSLEIRKPWYYRDRNNQILNCKCPYHKKKVAAHQSIQYTYLHEEGCHNESIRMYKVKVHDQVKGEIQQLWKVQSKRREDQLNEKRERIREERAQSISKLLLRRFARTSAVGSQEERLTGFRSASRSVRGSYYKTNTMRRILERKARGTKTPFNDETLLAQKSCNQHQNYNSNINGGQQPIHSNFKYQQSLIKQLISDPSTKHYGTFLSLRRRGYNFDGFPQVQKYLDCIQRQFKEIVEVNGGSAPDGNQFLKHAEMKLIDEYAEVDEEVANKLVQAWIENGASALRSMKRLSVIRQFEENRDLQKSNTKVNKKVGVADYHQGYIQYGKRAPEEGWRENKQNKDALRGHADSSKNSRRDSLASKISNGLSNITSSNFIKGSREDAFKSSLSKIGVNSRLKHSNSQTKKKKPDKPIKKKRYAAQKPEDHASRTMLPDVVVQEGRRVSEPILQTDTSNKKYTKPLFHRHRLSMFKNANSKLAINDQRSEVLQQLSRLVEARKQMNNPIQPPQQQADDQTQPPNCSSLQIVDPKQLKIGQMVIKSHKKRHGRLIFRDEYILNEFEEKYDDQSEDETQRQQQLIKQLKILRKKRLRLNLINHILFGNGFDSEEMLLSDVEGYGSSANLEDTRDPKKRRDSEKAIPRHASARFRPNGPKGPLVRFYDWKRDSIGDGILESINQLLVRRQLSHFCIDLNDSERMRNRKVRRLKQYLCNHPEIKANDLVRSIKLYQQHEKLTKATKMAIRLNYDPELLLSVSIPDDAIIKAILKAQSQKLNNPGFGYGLVQIDPHESSSASISLSDQQANIKQKVKGRLLPQCDASHLGNLFSPLDSDLVQRGLEQWSHIQNNFVLNHRIKQAILLLQQYNPDIIALPTNKIIQYLFD